MRRGDASQLFTAPPIMIIAAFHIAAGQQNKASLERSPNEKDDAMNQVCLKQRFDPVPSLGAHLATGTRYF